MLGVLLSALSLGWQRATFVLSGGRVKVHLIIGAMHPSAHTVDGVSLKDAAAILDASPAHLVRAFSRRFGLPPHLYLTGRRIEMARRLLVSGMPLAQVATAAGFYDQSHLTRRFRRHLGITAGNYLTRA